MRGLKVGFIGLGDMGAPIGRRICGAGFPLTIWARRAATVEPFRDEPNVSIAESIADVGRNSDIVGLCVFGDKDVRQVVLGEAGLIANMAPGGVILIHSTVSVELCEELDAVATDRGLAVLDVPVTGGRDGAKIGRLVLMAGGRLEAFERAKPVMASYGHVIERMGAIGSGQMTKLLNNTVVYSNIAISFLALDVGGEFGLDRAALTTVLRSGTATSSAYETMLDNVLLDPKFARHVGELIKKDTDLFRHMREKAGIEASLIDRASLTALEMAPRFVV
jgi:3-hydroxyisobutyrate dehydrogenase